MNNDAQTLAWMVPAIIAITRLCKGRVGDEFLPVIATVLGVLMSVGWALTQGNSIDNAVMVLGIVASASAQGVYSGVKTIAKGAAEEPVEESPPDQI